MMQLRILTSRGVAAILATMLIVAAAWAQESPDTQKPDDAEPTSETKDGDREKKDGVKPYDDVITKDATTDPGLFFVHRVDSKVFYEIPTEQLSTDMLWVTQIGGTQAGFSIAGMPVQDRVVRWELREESILLRDVKYAIRAEVDDPIKDAVERSSLKPIIRVFPVAAWGKDKAPVIDVTALFKSDVAEFSPKRQLDVSGVDEKRTFVEEIKSFPENIETKVLATYALSDREDNEPGERRRGRRDSSQSGVTVLLHHSMVKLPETLMKPRRFDERVGFITVRFEDYGTDVRHQVEDIRYITRWRLEKKDPNAEVSEPVKPIVFYVDRDTPAKWKPWVKKGIEMWQPAFEAAGFKNAILGKYAPSRREDPDWDAEDARISCIRWLPSTTENAFGPHVNDPRTGEILEADVRMYHNVLKLVRDWYFVQASPNDKRAQKLPLPDDLVGELLAYVVAHEVGHSIGFPHNMKASSTYTVEQLRDPEFTKQNGTEASIMDYGRFNYVAQPGDGAALIPVVGPYDRFAVEWGYRQFDKDADEKAELEKIVKRQIDEPMLRYGDANPQEDPSQQTEDLGSDPILATELGLKNIDRVASFLVTATCDKGEDYRLLENMYQRLHGQRNRELGHVANLVGGFVRTNLWFGDADRIYAPVDAAQQRNAIEFLNTHAFQVPKSLVAEDITLRLETNGVADRVLESQRSALTNLIDEDRIKRMAEQAQRAGDDGIYMPAEMLADVRRGIWDELDEQAVRIDLYRRNLQRAYVEHLSSLVRGASNGSDLPALARSELTQLRDAIGQLQNNELADAVTKAHLADMRARIEQSLDPRGLDREAGTQAGGLQ
jgi:hypothetical protein